MTIVEAMLRALRDAASYNKHELAAPRVILWPDEDRLWAQCIESVQADFACLWSLGDYEPDKGAGPAVWLRFRLETGIGDDVPVMYLPGIGRGAFRSAEQCPDRAKHLFALQFQGQFWTQRNGKDWTPFAFLSSSDGGLGLDVSADQETKRAVQECLLALLEVPIDDLRGRKLEAGDFRLIVTRDPADTILQWMGSPSKIRTDLQRLGVEWESFRAVCRADYGFDPETDGVISAAEKLTTSVPAWNLVWERYKKAPLAYPGIRELLASVVPGDLFAIANEYRPTYNREEEDRLEKALLELSSAQFKDALIGIEALAIGHGHRSEWVWATLGDAPLAIAIGHLREMAEVIQESGSPTTWKGLADYYSLLGWKVDWSVLRAMDAARSSSAAKAVAAAIRAAYLPWLEKFSILTQALAADYPNSGPHSCRTLPAESGTVYLFADGLRMDLARCLEERLVSSGLEVVFGSEWSALPTVTATAKHAWMPLADRLGGPLHGEGFEPKELSSGKTVTHARLKQLMEELGISYLTSDKTLFPTACAWVELGSIDSYGHNEGAKLAWRVEEELAGLQQCILELIGVGWTRIKVITDHGWIMLPGGLPKAELPMHLTTSRWGRCAIPSPGAQHGYPMTSWFWDTAEAVVLAPGVSCFVAGMEYAHGGLTLQEALVPSLKISAKETGGNRRVVVREVKWSGLRLNVVLDGAHGLTLDIRKRVADAATSFARSPMTAAPDGEKTSLLVVDDEAMGTEAFLVVIDEEGQPIFKQSIVIGES